MPTCLLALLAVGVAAQTAPPTAQGVGNYSLPASEPTPAPVPSLTPVAPLPVTPTTSPTPATRPTPRATATADPAAEPIPRVQATSRPVPRPTPPPIRTMPIDPGPPLAPAPTPTASAPIAPPLPRPVEPDNATPWWPWAAGAALLLALATAGLSRRRRPREAASTEPAVATPSPRPVAPPPLPRDPAPTPRPWIDVELHPRRGGLNLLSATVELEIAVRNTGDAAADAVLIEATLLPARSDGEGEIGALFARPVTRPATPAFTLAPGEERRVRAVAAIALANVEPLVARGRAMLVPVVAVNATYRWAGCEGQTAAAYVVGVEREGQAKLAPFWLDSPRVHEALAARPHALAVRR